MANKEKIDYLLIDIRELEKLVAGMRDAEIYPASFFNQTFQLTHKVLKELHTLEEFQLEALRKQMEEHQRLIDSIPVSKPLQMPEVQPAPEVSPTIEVVQVQEPVVEEPIVVEPIVEKVIPEEKIVQETIPLKEIEIPHKTILADKSSISLNDILEKKNLSDFRKAFSLNDRFRFRRELFGGNEEKMNKAISDLNDLSSYEESVTYLNKVLNWNIEDASVADFIKLLEKRFSYIYDMAKLTVVPTPVGNLEDMTFRAIRVLKEADLILAEDTRTTGILLKHFEIQNKMQSHHKFNEHKTVEQIAARIKGGENIALVSDAGTPAISDPGFMLVRECVRQGVDVECLPGATAFVPALVASGLPNEKFCFEGFLPQKKGRQTRLKELALEYRTIIFYESPFRLLKTLTQFAEFFGTDRQVSVSREISKLHEETVRGSLEEVIQHFTVNEPRGEIVIVLAGLKDKKDKETEKDV